MRKVHDIGMIFFLDLSAYTIVYPLLSESPGTLSHSMTKFCGKQPLLSAGTFLIYVGETSDSIMRVFYFCDKPLISCMGNCAFPLHMRTSDVHSCTFLYRSWGGGGSGRQVLVREADRRPNTGLPVCSRICCNNMKCCDILEEQRIVWSRNDGSCFWFKFYIVRREEFDVLNLPLLV